MPISSDKANMRAQAAVEFAQKHSWAKYPCLAAVSVIYSAEFVRVKILEAGEKLKAAVTAPFRPLGKRIASVFLSAAFAFMTVPFSAASVFADETDVPQQAEAKELPRPWTKLPPKEKTAATPEEIADRVTKSGLAEDNRDYDITLNVRTLRKDITADFRQSPKYLEQVITAFESYGIPVEGLNIQPVDVSVYTTEGKYLLQLSDGYSADITLPVPEDMQDHYADLKVIRLEDDGSIAILDGTVYKDTISFNTEHFSIFALVAYKDTDATAENISSGAGMTASSSAPQAAISLGGTAIEEDKNRFKKDKKRKIYRIRRIAKEDQLLLI